jgi:hypothetical protein
VVCSVFRPRGAVARPAAATGPRHPKAFEWQGYWTATPRRTGVSIVDADMTILFVATVAVIAPTRRGRGSSTSTP